jgi:hypothetical protein
LEERRLVVVARLADAMSADALVAFLAAHGIDAHLEGADPLSIGLGGRVRVVIAEQNLRRARSAIENADASAGGAWFLAAGELDPEQAKRAFAWRGTSAGARRARIAAAAMVIALAAAALLSR